MGSVRYAVDIDPLALPQAAGAAQVVFHGINKSGSLAMSKVMHEAHVFAGREPEFISHYHRGGPSEDFVRMINTSPAARSFVVGHGLWGALAPSANRIWITQFRHPLPRTLSCYQWLKRIHESKSSTPYDSLEQYVVRNQGIGHSQISQFGVANGPRRTRRRKGMTAENLLDICIDTLHAHVSLIGIAEHFEESIFAFAAICGLPSVTPWLRDDRNRGRKPVADLTAPQVEMIEHHYRCDFKLYQHALTLFREQNLLLGIEHAAALQGYRDACKAQYKDRII